MKEFTYSSCELKVKSSESMSYTIVYSGKCHLWTFYNITCAFITTRNLLMWFIVWVDKLRCVKYVWCVILFPLRESGKRSSTSQNRKMLIGEMKGCICIICFFERFLKSILFVEILTDYHKCRHGILECTPQVSLSAYSLFFEFWFFELFFRVNWMVT